MNSKKIIGIIALIRPPNLLIVFLTISAAAVLAGATIDDWILVSLASLAGAVIGGGGNAINDFFDAEIDAINRPNRPLPRGDVTKQEAWWVWRLASSAGVLLSAYVGPLPFAIALFWIVSLYFYSRVLKRKVLIGNLAVGVVTALAFVYGALSVGGFERSLIPAFFAFLVNLARELVKDVQDIEGDRRGGARTLPVVYGVKPALGLATLVIVLLIMSTVVPYANGTYNVHYLVLVGVADLALTYVAVSLWRSRLPHRLERLSLVLKFTMVLGLAAIYIGS